LAIHGYTTEVEEAYARALEIAEAHPELPQLFPVLRGLASFYMARAELDKEVPIGRSILRLAEVQDDPRMRVHGHLVVGRCTAFQGDLHGGLEHLDSAINLFESQGYSSRRFLLGPNPGVASFTTSALVLWMLGYPDRALERANRAVAVATDLGPFTLAFALFHSGFLHIWRREPQPVGDRGRGVLEVADEHDLPVWKALGTFLLGAAETDLGRHQEGLAHLNQGLDLYRDLTTPPVFWPLILYVQAGANARSGNTADGLDLIDQALEFVQSGHSGRNPVLPELFMRKGDLLLALPHTNGAADDWFQRAFDFARDVDARMLQLRAALRLCRLGRERGEPEPGDRALRAVYETFAEGFTTADLIEARSLLEGRL
jgi:tetratricopeptide (TPR) repeat protein